MDRVALADLFGGLQEVLSANLGTARAVIGHPGAKGAATEDHWRDMLGTYLPSRYRVSSGFVVDADGLRSDQIDVIIHDRQYSPFLFHHEGATHVPAESVYAVFEVKQAINKTLLDYAADKAASVRALRRTSVPVVHVDGVSPPKQPGPILSGYLALESDWADGLGGSFRENVLGLQGDRMIDLGCVLQHGAFERCQQDESGVRTSAPTASLVWFFVTLVSRLQALGTVPAMDLRAYLASVDG